MSKKMLIPEIRLICYSNSRILECPYYLSPGCDEVCNYSVEMNKRLTHKKELERLLHTRKRPNQELKFVLRENEEEEEEGGRYEPRRS